MQDLCVIYHSYGLTDIKQTKQQLLWLHMEGGKWHIKI
jgi:hypothetical protein